MNRRGFLGMSLAAAGMVFAPKFGRWHRQGSGLLVPDGHYLTLWEGGRVYAHIPMIEGQTSTLYVPGRHEFSITETYRMPAWIRRTFPDFPETKTQPHGRDITVWGASIKVHAPSPLVRIT